MYDTYRLSAPIWAFCRYIGFADKQKAYRLLADKKIEHIGAYRYWPIRKKADLLYPEFLLFLIIFQSGVR